MQPIIDLVKRAKPKTLLDYGCGNGLVNTLLDKDIEKTLFDINLDNFDNLAISDLKECNCKIIKQAKDLPSNYFDVVVLSFVLVAVPDEKQFTEILQNIKRVKKKDGILIIVDSHPCFLQYDCSWFYSESPVKFPYLTPGAPFKRGLADSKDREIYFTDYHWPLSFIINKLSECGLSIVRMEEIADGGFGPRPKNELYPPIYSMVCK
ncbi:MAG: class I SAM-dependent methyltransferase [Alphaproteobacteria bacterium]|nr:class I SAM-dependent methyltransferase [Alphaproteobacteria bacterium]